MSQHRTVFAVQLRAVSKVDEQEPHAIPIKEASEARGITSAFQRTFTTKAEAEAYHRGTLDVLEVFRELFSKMGQLS